MTKHKTDADFKQEVFDLVGDEYEFLEPYVNSKAKLRVKHTKCGKIYEVRPHDFLSGKRCPYCSGKMKKTDAQFKQEVHDLVGNEYTFLDPYTTSKTKIRVKHNKCGHIYEVKPNNFLNGSRCPFCSSKDRGKARRKTNAQFKKEVFDLVGNEYTFLEPYVNSYTKLKVKHNKCNDVYKVTPSNFLSGYRCPYCSVKASKTDAQFKQEVYDLVGDEYTFLEPYVNNATKIRVKHNECGNVYKVNPNSFLHGSRCSYCFGNHKKTDAQFKQEVSDLVGEEYEFLDEYVKANVKIRVKHNTCGNTYEVRPTDFFSHHARCPYCNSSKGELIISKILDILTIDYESQKTFDDLRDINLLSYDFYIPNQSILIEYQGQQHYQPLTYFGGEYQFKVQQKHDKMKADYAKKHNYNLIAVPYTYDTFSKIKKYLLKHGLFK